MFKITVSDKSKEKIRLEYEKDYLERLATKGKINSIKIEEHTISEEERIKKVKEAEKIQIESAQQIQNASAVKIQSEVDIKNKHAFMNKEILSLIDELKILKEVLNKKFTKRKVTKESSF